MSPYDAMLANDWEARCEQEEEETMERYQISDRPKQGQWWVWDHQDDRMPKIVGRYWSRAEAKQQAAAMNESDLADEKAQERRWRVE